MGDHMCVWTPYAWQMNYPLFFFNYGLRHQSTSSSSIAFLENPNLQSCNSLLHPMLNPPCQCDLYQLHCEQRTGTQHNLLALKFLQYADTYNPNIPIKVPHSLEQHS